jgi:hypothetical protein
MVEAKLEAKLTTQEQGCAKLGEVLETKFETKLWKFSNSKLEIRNPKNLEISQISKRNSKRN